jgi:hypothetical protein
MLTNVKSRKWFLDELILFFFIIISIKKKKPLKCASKRGMRGVLSLVHKRQKNDSKAVLMVCKTSTVSANIHALFLIYKLFNIFHFIEYQLFMFFIVDN